MKWKRSQKLCSRRESGRRPRDQEQTLPSSRAKDSGLPPNDKLNKFADEVYGDTEISRRERRP